MIEAVVLDIGGVVLRTEDRTGRQTLEGMYGLPLGGADELIFNSKEAIDSTIGLVDQKLIWQNAANKLNLSNQELVEFQNYFWQGDQIDQPLIDFLMSFQNKYKTAFLTNAWLGARATLAERYHLIEGETVNKILISSELGVAKPNERIYHILSTVINAPFDNILFIDDFSENIIAAKALGMQTIHYKPGIDLISTLKNQLTLD